MKTKKQIHCTKFLAASLALALTSLALPTAAGASTSTPAPSFKSGFYLGAQAGYSQMKGKIDGVFDADGPGLGEPALTADRQVNKTHTSAVGDIVLGYRHIFNNSFSLGTDISFGYDGNYLKLRVDHTHPNAGNSPFDNKLKRTFFVIPSLVLGKVLTNRVHGFFKLGLSISRFKNEINNVLDTKVGTLGSSKTKIGIVPAIGLEYAITSKISLTGTLSYEGYGNFEKKYKSVSSAEVKSEYTSKFRRIQFFSGKIGILFKI